MHKSIAVADGKRNTAKRGSEQASMSSFADAARERTGRGKSAPEHQRHPGDVSLGLGEAVRAVPYTDRATFEPSAGAQHLSDSLINQGIARAAKGLDPVHTPALGFLYSPGAAYNECD
jgi:hypothetical protein